MAAATAAAATRQAALEENATDLAARTKGAAATAAASVYALSAARQDLALSLSRVGDGELDAAAGDDEATPFSTAALVMRGDASMAEAAEATAAAVRRLLSRLVMAVQEASAGAAGNGAGARPPLSPGASAAVADVLATRLRDAEDHSEMLRAADEVLRSNVEAAREDADATASELALRRNQVVKLALTLAGVAPGAGGKGAPGGEGGASTPASAAAAATAASAAAAGEGDPDGGGGGAGAPVAMDTDTAGAAGDAPAGPPAPDLSVAAHLAAVEASNKELRSIAAARLAELGAALEATRALAVSAERDAGSRDRLRSAEVLGSRLYQAMEHSLTNLALAQREWQTARAAAVDARGTAASAAAAELKDLRTSTEQRAASLSSALGDALRGAEAAKAARDRLNLTYEARKLEAASDRGAADTEVVLERASERQTALQAEVARLTARLTERQQLGEAAAAKLAASKLDTSEEVQARLRRELDEAKAASDSLISEVEALSSTLSTVEAHNTTLSDRLSAKESTLSSVMSDRLKMRQAVVAITAEQTGLAAAVDASATRLAGVSASIAAARKAAADATAAAMRSAADGSAAAAAGRAATAAADGD